MSKDFDSVVKAVKSQSLAPLKSNLGGQRLRSRNGSFSEEHKTLGKLDILEIENCSGNVYPFMASSPPLAASSPFCYTVEPGFYDTRSNDILDFTITFLSPDKSTVKCMKKDLDLTIFYTTISSILQCKFILPSVNLTSIQRYNWFWLSTKSDKHKTTHVQHYSNVLIFFSLSI